MRVSSMSVAIMVVGLAPAAFAQEEAPARAFLQESNGALLGCARLVKETDLALRLYGSAAPVHSGERVTCVAQAKDRLRAAYDAYLATNPAADAKASAKALYSANLALGDAIVDATSAAQLDDSQEQASVRKAKSSFVVDAGP